MIAVVRNGVCEIHNHLGHRLVTLPPVNIDEAVLQGKYVAVVLRNGYCQLYLTSGDTCLHLHLERREVRQIPQ